MDRYLYERVYRCRVFYIKRHHRVTKTSMVFQLLRGYSQITLTKRCGYLGSPEIMIYKVENVDIGGVGGQKNPRLVNVVCE